MLSISVKGQILADFIVERLEDDSLATTTEAKEELPELWTLFMDGSSCIDGSRAGLILTNREGTTFTYAMRFRFDVTNNEAGYEDLIASLRIAEQIEKVKTLASSFIKFSIKQVLVEEFNEKSINEKESSNEDTPFSLMYGTEAVIPTDFGMPNLRTAEIDMVHNDDALEINLDLLEERKEQAAIHKARSKEKMEKFYNSKVRNTSFKP
nr:reverse transcriptase domain-containing protein [Tanacetum cinerariifolium]